MRQIELGKTWGPNVKHPYKFTSDQVKTILESKDIAATELAERFDVHPSAIRRIRYGKNRAALALISS